MAAVPNPPWADGTWSAGAWAANTWGPRTTSDVVETYGGQAPPWDEPVQAPAVIRGRVEVVGLAPVVVARGTVSPQARVTGAAMVSGRLSSVAVAGRYTPPPLSRRQVREEARQEALKLWLLMGE